MIKALCLMESCKKSFIQLLLLISQIYFTLCNGINLEKNNPINSFDMCQKPFSRTKNNKIKNFLDNANNTFCFRYMRYIIKVFTFPFSLVRKILQIQDVIKESLLLPNRLISSIRSNTLCRFWQFSTDFNLYNLLLT